MSSLLLTLLFHYSLYNFGVQFAKQVSPTVSHSANLFDEGSGKKKLIFYLSNILCLQDIIVTDACKQPIQSTWAFAWEIDNDEHKRM